jgi:hypothetical protein
MIKANDLRVGNKVYYNTGESIEVHTIDSVDIKLAEQYNLLFNANHSPIPLTEEWLIKMGFSLYSSEGRYLITPNNEIELLITLESDNENTYCYIDIYQHIDKEDDEGAEIVFLTKENYYLHQLQNLYYALTNEELTINL